MREYARKNRKQIREKILLLIERMEPHKVYRVIHPSSGGPLDLTRTRVEAWLEYFKENRIDDIGWDWVMDQANQIWKKIHSKNI